MPISVLFLLSEPKSKTVTFQTWACISCQKWEGGINYKTRYLEAFCKTPWNRSRPPKIDVAIPCDVDTSVQTHNFHPPPPKLRWWAPSVETAKIATCQERTFLGIFGARPPKSGKTPLLNDKLPKFASEFQRRTMVKNIDIATVPKPPHDYLGKCLRKWPASAQSRNAAQTCTQSLWQQQAHSCTHERSHSCILKRQTMAHSWCHQHICIYPFLLISI